VAVTAAILAAMSLCATIAAVAMQLSAQAGQAAVSYLDTAVAFVAQALESCAVQLSAQAGQAAVSYLDTAVAFVAEAVESWSARTVELTIRMLNWIVTGVDSLVRLTSLSSLSVGQLVATFGIALSGPAAITLLIVAMLFARLFAPRVGEFLNDVLCCTSGRRWNRLLDYAVKASVDAGPYSPCWATHLAYRSHYRPPARKARPK
jgi:hypothetical protein